MENGFPVPLCVGFGCNLLALLFLFVWPKGKAERYRSISWPRYILHYSQSLAWVFFGIAALFQTSSIWLALTLVVLGVMIYLAFLVILVKT